MARPRKHDSRKPGKPDGSGSRDRSAYQLRIRDEFKESAGADKSLGRAKAIAAAEAFFKLWQEVESDDGLANSRFRYETLQQPKAKAVRLKQVYIGGRKEVHRAALVVVSEGELAVWFLLTYPKGKQSASIDAGAEIAKAVRGAER